MERALARLQLKRTCEGKLKERWVVLYKWTVTGPAFVFDEKEEGNRN